MRGILVWMILIIILVCGEALGVDLKGQMKEVSPVPEGLKKEMKEAPPIPEGFKKEKSDLSIERIYLKDCKVFVVIRNRGTGGVSSEDYKSGKLLVQLNWRVPRGGGEVREFLLSQVDRYGNLRRSGGEVDFDTEITLGATEIYHVRAELLNLRDDADRGQKRLFQDLTLSKECVSRPKTPETRKPPTAGFPSPPQIEKPFKEKPFPERETKIEKISPQLQERIPERLEGLKLEGNKTIQYISREPGLPSGKISPMGKDVEKQLEKAEVLEKAKAMSKPVSSIICPQQGKSYYYKELGFCTLEISEDGNAWSAFTDPTICFNWPDPETMGDSYEFSYKLIGIDDHVEFKLYYPPYSFYIGDPLSFGIYRGDDVNDYNFHFYTYFFGKYYIPGRKYQIELKMINKTTGSIVTYRSPIFILNLYQIPGYGEGEKPPQVNNPFVMEFKLKNEDLMTPGYIKVKENVEGEEWHGWVGRGFYLKFRTKDGKPIKEVCNYDKKRYPSFEEYLKSSGSLSFYLVYKGYGKKSKKTLINTTWSPLLDLRNFSLKNNVIEYPEFKVVVDLEEPGIFEFSFYKIEFCGYTFHVPKKIIIYEGFSEDEVKPFELSMRVEYFQNKEVQYVTPKKEYEVKFNFSPNLEIDGYFVFSYFDPVSNSWKELFKKRAADMRKTSNYYKGTYREGFILEDLAKTYYGKKIKFRLELRTNEFERHEAFNDYNLFTEVVKEYPFRNIIIIQPKISDRIYRNRPNLIKWLSSDEGTGQVEIWCNEFDTTEGGYLIGRVFDNGTFLWIPSYSARLCKYIEVVKPGSSPKISDKVLFEGLYDIAIKIVNPVEDIMAGPIQIIWDIFAPEEEKRGKVKLYYRTKAEGNMWGDWMLIADEIPVSKGYYIWDVSAEASQKDVQLKIVWEKPPVSRDSRTRFEHTVQFKIKNK